MNLSSVLECRLDMAKRFPSLVLLEELILVKWCTSLIRVIRRHVLLLTDVTDHSCAPVFESSPLVLYHCALLLRVG